MYKSLLLLCLVGLVCAQTTQNLNYLLQFIYKYKPTEATVYNVHEPSTIVQRVSQPHDLEDQPCTARGIEDGRCVPYYLCDSNNTIIDDGGGVIDIRSYTGRLHCYTTDFHLIDDPSSTCNTYVSYYPFLGSSKGSACKSYLDVCCKITDEREKGNLPARPNETKEGCGWRNPDGIGFKIIGDKDGESEFGEFPWMVAILKIEPVNQANPNSKLLNIYLGGGSLIHPAVVLTTAHSVVSAEVLKVRAGEWDTQTIKEILPHQDRDVESTVVHEKYNNIRKNLFYDIAVLFLSLPMDTSVPNVGLACLPPPHQHTRAGESCVASGWGQDKFGKNGRYQVILKKVTVPAVARNQCQRQLRKTRLGRYFKLHSSFMCAGGEAGIDTCRGDGGSPLMCPIEDEPNRYMQSGMVAWGIGCGEDGTPGVYVDVSSLRNWIDDKIVGKGLDPEVYTI